MINITLTDTTNSLFHSYLKGWEIALLVYDQEFGANKHKAKTSIK